MNRHDVSALIVAGGQATRLGGIDKRAIIVDGQTIFERQIAAVSRLVHEVIVSGRTAVAGYRNVVDEVPGLGPLSGIAAGLASTDTPWLLVLAGDMPRIDPAVIELVLSHAEPADAVGIRIGGRAEPLFSLLRVAVWRPIARARLAAQQLRVSALLTDEPARVHWIEEAELRAVDPQLRSLHNVNTPEDL